MALQSSSGSRENTSISFPNWKAVLARTTLSGWQQSRHESEIIAFLRYCKSHRAPATVFLARQYLAAIQSDATRAATRLALRWFFQTAPMAGSAAGEGIPPEVGRAP